MVENARKPYDGFMGSKYAKLLGLVLSFVVSFAILALLGTKYGIYVFVGIILYIIPRLFHVKDYKAMAILGVAFLLVSTLVGGLMFTAPAMMGQTTDDMSDDDFTDISVTDLGDGMYQVKVTYEDAGDPEVCYGPIRSCCFSNVGSLNTHLVRSDLEKAVTGARDGYVYTYSIELSEGTPWYMYFHVHTDDGDVYSERGMITENISESQVKSFAVSTNFMTIIIPIIAFFIILVVMFLFNRKMGKVRKEMEDEGRLYPQGMGRCKECGMIILPGETVCRKCGAVIDVPEEYRRKPAEPKTESHFECSECGAVVPADSKVCPKCGATFDDDDDE